jgi:hypothetical protein
MRRSMSDMNEDLDSDPQSVNVLLQGEHVVLRMPAGCTEVGFDESHARRLASQLHAVADRLHERLTGKFPRRRGKRRR